MGVQRRFFVSFLHPKMGYRQDKEWEGGDSPPLFQRLIPSSTAEVPLLSPKEEEEEEEEEEERAKHVVGGGS